MHCWPPPQALQSWPPKPQVSGSFPPTQTPPEQQPEQLPGLQAPLGMHFPAVQTSLTAHCMQACPVLPQLLWVSTLTPMQMLAAQQPLQVEALQNADPTQIPDSQV